MTTIEPTFDLSTERPRSRVFEPLCIETAGARPVPFVRTPIRKRILDVSIAAPAALITLPVPMALAAWAAIRYRANPLFNQPRLGHGGKLFKFWKIRSLPPIAPETADKYQLRAIELPRLASVIRFRHLDELPQLFLVLSGKMSLVGPRPEMPTLANSFDTDFVDKRLSVLPGCTGLWQISTSARKLIGEHPEFDLHYVRNWTLRLDLWVLYRTVLAMGFNHEIETVDEIPRWTGAAAR
jgi:lipopolysaccharide/colanic/teichoic acid biosynthesis glycosyltransferase